MTEEYIEPTRKHRIIVSIKIIFLIALYIALRIFIPRYIAFVSEKPICNQQLWWQFSLVILFLTGLLIIYQNVRNGYLLIINNQLPLPGTNVFFRTKIVRGWRVKIDAISSFVIAFCIFLGLIYLAQTGPVVGIFTIQCIGA